MGHLLDIRGISVVRTVLALAIFLGVGAALYKGGEIILFATRPAITTESPKTAVLIHKGELPTAVSKHLAEAGIISNPTQFYRLGIVFQKWRNIKAGEYELSASMNPLQVFEVITSGVSILHPLTIREGINMYQIGDLLESQGLMSRAEFLEFCRRPDLVSLVQSPSDPSLNLKTLEGYLYPETYKFGKTTPKEDMVRTMIRNFNAVWTPEFDARAKELDMDRHQVVTLASMVEKETGAPEERPTISSVFHNRLKKRMRLESDPTTIYGIWETWGGNIRREHLKEKNDFNTYQMYGLPKGPISNPGVEAIRAALFPKDSPYFYFVSKNNGSHVFSETYKDHSKAVQDFQVNRAAREGKSWRDRLAKQKK